MTKEQRQCNGVVFSTNGTETIGHIHAKTVHLDTDFIPFIKFNSKWITDLNVKHKNIKLLEDNIGENIDDLGYGDNYSDTMTKA